LFGIIKLYGKYGLAGLIMVIGYLFYDKSQMTSILLEIIGVILASGLIIFAIEEPAT
jgi:hypothetical protein